VWDALGTLGDVLCTSDFDRIVFADVSCSASSRGVVRCVLWLHIQLVTPLEEGWRRSTERMGGE
jgi:hypothetical protein